MSNKKVLPRIPGNDSARVWVNEAAGLVVTDFLGSGDNLDQDDLDQGFNAYSMGSVFSLDGPFCIDKLDDVNDGYMDYDNDAVDSDSSCMTLLHDEEEYDDPDHFGNVLGLLGVVRQDGWVQVAGPSFMN